MKSLQLPLADVRKNFADVIASARSGQRIRLTRHGKTMAWIIGEADHAKLERKSTLPREPRR